MLTFEPVSHTYRRPDGRLVPSVTTILSAVGIGQDYEAIRSYSAEHGDAVERKREIGSALHADAHAFDDDDLDFDTVHPDVRPYLDAWATFRANAGVVPIARERVVYHAALGYCGTLDGLFRTPDGRTVLIDIKTGDPDDSGCRYQTAGYQMAYQVDHSDVVVHERWGVQLTPDRQIPYRVHPYTDWRDHDTWRAIVTTFYCGRAARSYAA